MRHDGGLSITSNFFWDPSYVNPNEVHLKFLWTILLEHSKELKKKKLWLDNSTKVFLLESDLAKVAHNKTSPRRFSNTQVT